MYIRLLQIHLWYCLGHPELAARRSNTNDPIQQEKNDEHFHAECDTLIASWRSPIIGRKRTNANSKNATATRFAHATGSRLPYHVHYCCCELEEEEEIHHCIISILYYSVFYSHLSSVMLFIITSFGCCILLFNDTMDDIY